MKVTILFLFSILTLFCVTLVPVHTLGNTYYVSTSGNDANAGTAAAPWRTLRSGVSRLKAGDTLYIRGGTYGNGSNYDYRIADDTITIPSGTSFSNAVTIAGYPGETVTIQTPADGNDVIHLSTTSHQYIIFQDLIIDGALTNNDYISALVYLSGAQSHIRFQRLEVKNSWYSGVNDYTTDTDGTANGGSNEWLNCSFHHNGRRPDGLYGGGGNSGQGYYGKASNTLIDHCNVYNNHGYGMGINFDNNIVRNCTIHDNGGLIGSNQTLGTNYGIYIGSGGSAGVTNDNNLIYNNLIYGNRGGILVYSDSANTRIYNNTIYNNGPAGGAIDVQYIAGDATMQNNILYANTVNAVTNKGGFLGGSIIKSYNLFSDPAFVNPGAGDFRLQSSSAARNAGITLTSVPDDYAGVLRPQNGPYAIGAYEYASGLRPPTNVLVGP